MMNKNVLIAAGAVFALSSTVAMSESKIKESVVVNQSLNKKNATIAIGEDNLSSTGSVNIKDAKIKKSLIVNQTKNKKNATITDGVGNDATTGSISVE